MQDGAGQVRGLGRVSALLFGVTPEERSLTPDVLTALWVAEIRAQGEAIARERPIRVVVIVLLAVVFGLFLPWYLVALAAIGVVLGDLLEKMAMTSALRHPGQTICYWVALAGVYLGEVCFCLPAAVLWQVDDAFTKAISVGVLAAAMMRLATIRSVHPQTGLAGSAALASLIAVSNSSYWIGVGNLAALALTSLIAVVSISYVISAILLNHRMQRLAAVAKHVAQRANDAKSRFLAQMSHELRTPLNAIIGTGTSAFLMTSDARVKEQLAVLLASAEGLALVLNDVLDLSAVEEGRIALRPRVADVAAELGQSVALFRPQAEALGLEMRLEVQAGLPALRLDFDRLRQCLSNLLSNALKHTLQGQVVVRVRFDAPDLVIEVQDSGSGVPAGLEERIFNRYERGPALHEGHGLGLAICRMLLDRMGGEIGLLPAATGALFYIRVPAEVAQAEVVLPGPVVDLGGVRVLVVDDIASNRLVAATYLRLLGCVAVEAATGPEALALLGGPARFNLMLVDMNMPGMGGLEVLRAVRDLPLPLAGLPVVAMTADALDHDRHSYLAAGLDGYVTKPIHLDTLRAEVVRVLGR